MTAGPPVLSVDDLRVTYPGPPELRALDGVSLQVSAGECLAVLGESGSGKSTLARVLLGVAADARVEGTVRLGESDLQGLNEKGWRAVRWRRIALAPQSTASLNPVLRVGLQLAEPQQVHLGRSRSDSDARSVEALGQVGLGDWAVDRYPSQLSGGQKRQVLLALALVCDPDVIVLDEPTSGLDPVVRNQVIATLSQLVRTDGRALVLLGHDVEAMAALADRVAVLYRGWVAETGPATRVLRQPRAPFTWALLNARPTLASLKELRGIRDGLASPDAAQLAAGCPFVDRCTQAVDACSTERPGLAAPEGEDGQRLVACLRGGLVTILRARDLHKSYRVGRHRSDAAVDGVSLAVRHGEVVGVVGATGAGKSTLAALLVGLLPPDQGTVCLDGQDLAAIGPADLRRARRRIQLLFQDPFEALSPRLTIGDAVREPLDVQKDGDPHWREERVRIEFSAVRLPTDASFLARRSHELSGGQLQRVALARALVLDPQLLVADEPFSMLDPSEQANLLQLLKRLQVERGMAMVLVSHDLAVVMRTADRILVLDRGRVVEEGTGTELLISPQHPVTRSLLAAAGRDRVFAGFTAPESPER
ncbi:MAG: peptide/nickel transport system ATP-binding protein ddpF [Acidimicrobiaceae bacterium]|nr:peptide/nickel transport system ATP-binding protein ddpF [Acidimicrobiaceae bacterium]